MKFKKYLLIFILLFFTLLLAGCGKKEAPENTSIKDAAQKAAEQTKVLVEQETKISEKQ